MNIQSFLDLKLEQQKVKHVNLLVCFCLGPRNWVSRALAHNARVHPRSQGKALGTRLRACRVCLD